MATIPVAICTVRPNEKYPNGDAYVLFGKHYDSEGARRTFYIGNGPDIAKWEKLFDEMERLGVTMLIPENARWPES
jgi:hypothetical protein